MRIHSSSLRRGLLVGLGLPASAFLALGVVWATTRLQPHPLPRWDERGFVPLRSAPGGPEMWFERWVVAVHPGCPHCRSSLGHLAHARDRMAARVRIAALVVDAPAAPPDSAVAHWPADEVLWDVAGRWRASWGHRIYGEVLCFDATNQLIRQLAPLATAEDAAHRLEALHLNTLPD